MDKSIFVEIGFKPFSTQKINDQFTMCKCYVMALGKNRNFSHFTKEAVDSAVMKNKLCKCKFLQK